MKLLLDEDVAEPLTLLVKRLLRGHEVHHVRDLSWKGKKDLAILRDAPQAGFEAILTNDLAQLNDPDECRAIKRSGLHHIRYEMKPTMQGLGMACGAICAAIRPIVEHLEECPGQRLVRIHKLSGGPKRYDLVDPAKDPPSYWR